MGCDEEEVYLHAPTVVDMGLGSEVVAVGTSDLLWRFRKTFFSTPGGTGSYTGYPISGPSFSKFLLHTRHTKVLRFANELERLGGGIPPAHHFHCK